MYIECEEIPSHLGYHDTCYRRFIDAKRIRGAEKRCSQTMHDDSAIVDDCMYEPSPKKLRMHALRANYQAAIHQRSICQWINAPSPVGHGWQMVDGKLGITWMRLNPGPDILLQVSHCSCNVSKCAGLRCSCRKNNVPCTDMCKCTNCENANTENSDDTDVSDDDEEEVSWINPDAN